MHSRRRGPDIGARALVATGHRCLPTLMAVAAPRAQRSQASAGDCGGLSGCPRSNTGVAALGEILSKEVLGILPDNQWLGQLGQQVPRAPNATPATGYQLMYYKVPHHSPY